MFEKIYRSLVLFLLVLIALGLGASLYFTYTVNNQRAVQSELCRKAIESVDFPGLLNEYQRAVYDTPEVDTIYQQTFLANEYQLMAITSESVILSACLPSLL